MGIKIYASYVVNEEVLAIMNKEQARRYAREVMAYNLINRLMKDAQPTMKEEPYMRGVGTVYSMCIEVEDLYSERSE